MNLVDNPLSDLTVGNTYNCFIAPIFVQVAARGPIKKTIDKISECAKINSLGTLSPIHQETLANLLTPLAR